MSVSARAISVVTSRGTLLAPTAVTTLRTGLRIKVDITAITLEPGARTKRDTPELPEGRTNPASTAALECPGSELAAALLEPTIPDSAVVLEGCPRPRSAVVL